MRTRTVVRWMVKRMGDLGYGFEILSMRREDLLHCLVFSLPECERRRMSVCCWAEAGVRTRWAWGGKWAHERRCREQGASQWD
jgi:hypothetical protein